MFRYLIGIDGEHLHGEEFFLSMGSLLFEILILQLIEHCPITHQDQARKLKEKMREKTSTKKKTKKTKKSWMFEVINNSPSLFFYYFELYVAN